MNELEGYKALILLQATGDIIYKRRQLERMCGYPADYGGDELLLKNIDEFFKDKNITLELQIAHEYYDKLLPPKKP